MKAASSQEEYAALRAVAEDVLPAGNFGNMASDIVIRNGNGARVWDEGGKEYIDFLLGSGPMLLGHNHPEVNRAATEQISRGTTFFLNNRQGIKLAEAIKDAVPCADKVRFVSTGSEADAFAMRLVRAFTKKNKILKFEGAYHGMSDYGLMSLAPKQSLAFPTPEPDSAGIPPSVQAEMLVAPFNDLDFATDLIHQYRNELAGVIVEPLQRIISPKPGFLEGLRRITQELGIPLIFDEVVTGFRLSYGGAQEFYGITPDLCTLGKACGGGYPLAAIAGRADIMSCFDEEEAKGRFVYQVGTLSGNPVASAAGLETLKILKRPGTYEHFFEMGRDLMDFLSEHLRSAGLPGQVVGIPPMFDVVFRQGPIENYRDVQGANRWLTQRFNQLQRERGILKTAGKYYVSIVLTEEDIEFTKAVWASSLEQLSAEYTAKNKNADAKSEGSTKRDVGQ